MKEAIGIALAALTMQASAVNWEYVTTDIKGNKYFIDTDTMRVDHAGGTRHWMLVKYKTAQTLGKKRPQKYVEMLTDDTQHCGSRSTTRHNYYFRSKDGTIVHSEENAHLQMPVLPESVGETLHIRACPQE